MKHRFILPAALVAAALSLAACTPASIVEPSGATATPAPSADANGYVPLEGVEPNAALADMEWVDNGEGAEPGLTFTSPINFTTSGARVVEDGDGAAITADQVLSLEVVQFSGNDGTVQVSTYAEGQPTPVPLDAANFDPVLYDLLLTVHVGARVLYAVPDQGAGSAIVAFSISGAADVVPPLPRAEGEAVAPAAGLPPITLDGTGKPSVSFAGATKSTELVAQDLITGAGPAVVEGQSVTVHYTGWVWDGAQFDSSWDRGAPATFTLATGKLIDGWVQGLVGKTVGSQVLLVIPPALGYGAAGQGESIPGDSTLVFVVDILAAS